MIRRYSELCKLKTFDERLKYLMLNGEIGASTFGYNRYLNQTFYRSSEWKSLRRSVIIRDNGCDLGLDGYQIQGAIYVHHMNPIGKEDILNRSDFLLNPDYLICASFQTHQAITYGLDALIPKKPVERKANDTCPWK